MRNNVDDRYYKRDRRNLTLKTHTTLFDIEKDFLLLFVSAIFLIHPHRTGICP